MLDWNDLKHFGVWQAPSGVRYSIRYWKGRFEAYELNQWNNAVYRSFESFAELKAVVAWATNSAIESLLLLKLLPVDETSKELYAKHNQAPHFWHQLDLHHDISQAQLPYKLEEFAEMCQVIKLMHNTNQLDKLSPQNRQSILEIAELLSGNESIQKLREQFNKLGEHLMSGQKGHE